MGKGADMKNINKMIWRKKNLVVILYINNL